jgi:hypothetical protein
MLHALSKTGARRVALDRDSMVQSLAGGSWQFAPANCTGSTSLVLNAGGGVRGEAQCYPYGAERWRWPQEGASTTDYASPGSGAR